jgi:hypothetical protein
VATSQEDKALGVALFLFVGWMLGEMFPTTPQPSNGRRGAPRPRAAQGVGADPLAADYIAIGGRPDMSLDDLRAAFRATVRKVHPDWNRSDSDATQDTAHVTAAWARIEQRHARMHAPRR